MHFKNQIEVSFVLEDQYEEVFVIMKLSILDCEYIFVSLEVVNKILF